jgi:ATP-dependent helicase/nuclease subunit B
VTTIEKWIANPYAVFAERILRLQPLPLLGEPPGPALRGQVVHEALGGFARKYPRELPPDIARELLAIAEILLTEMSGNPRIAAFWAPRFARFADWFAETEPARRETVNKVVGEVSGSLVLDAPQGPFTLEARADRIDIAAGDAVITDYKTAANLERLRKRAEDCDAPQLPLEAAIALAGGFAGLPTSTVSKLRYISVSGGEPAGQEVVLRVDDVAALARQARDGLQRLVAEFDRETTPYRAVRRARFSYTYDAYAHLARVAEWAVESGEEE